MTISAYLSNNTAVKIATSPAEDYQFNYTTKEWEDPRTLETIKEDKWYEIKQARNIAEYSGFTWNNYVFDSDMVSQNRITGAVTLAQITPDFTVSWVLKDNSIKTLNATEMLEVGLALGNHVASQFAKSQALRELIDNANSKEEVKAIVW